MTKKIKKLEKETAMYRSRWESSNKALLEMAEEVMFYLGLFTKLLVSQHPMDCHHQMISDTQSVTFHESLILHLFSL